MADLLIEWTGERSVRSIALRSGYDPSTLTRQLKSGIKAETVIDVARAFQLPVVGSLVRFGFLTEDEAGSALGEASLAASTDEQLAQEILDRVRRGNATSALTESIDANPSNVARLEDHRSIELDDERAVASEASEDRGEDGEYDA